MKVGITLPQFRHEADSAIGSARRAEELGLDGVFCFDHLWPMGQPERPSLACLPLLGALAASTASIRVGALVARIGLLPDELLVAELASLHAISGGRLIAGLGTGDSLSRAENDAFGIPFDAAGERRVRLASVAVAVAARGIPVWVGGGRPSTTELARTVGGSVNLWEGDLAQVTALTASGFDVTWGGSVPADSDGARKRLGELAGAGAQWAVCAWPDSLDAVADAAESVR